MDLRFGCQTAGTAIITVHMPVEIVGATGTAAWRHDIVFTVRKKCDGAPGKPYVQPRNFFMSEDPDVVEQAKAFKLDQPTKPVPDEIALGLWMNDGIRADKYVHEDLLSVLKQGVRVSAPAPGQTHVLWLMPAVSPQQMYRPSIFCHRPVCSPTIETEFDLPQHTSMTVKPVTVLQPNIKTPMKISYNCLSDGVSPVTLILRLQAGGHITFQWLVVCGDAHSFSVTEQDVSWYPTLSQLDSRVTLATPTRASLGEWWTIDHTQWDELHTYPVMLGGYDLQPAMPLIDISTEGVDLAIASKPVHVLAVTGPSDTKSSAHIVESRNLPLKLTSWEGVPVYIASIQHTSNRILTPSGEWVHPVIATVPGAMTITATSSADKSIGLNIEIDCHPSIIDDFIDIWFTIFVNPASSGGTSFRVSKHCVASNNQSIVNEPTNAWSAFVVIFSILSLAGVGYVLFRIFQHSKSQSSKGYRTVDTFERDDLDAMSESDDHDLELTSSRSRVAVFEPTSL